MKTRLMVIFVLVLLLLAYPSGARKGMRVGFSLVSQPSASDSLRANFTYSSANPVVNQLVFLLIILLGTLMNGTGILGTARQRRLL